MLHKNLVLHKFENGFRILSTKDLDDKFFVIAEKSQLYPHETVRQDVQPSAQTLRESR